MGVTGANLKQHYNFRLKLFNASLAANCDSVRKTNIAPSCSWQWILGSDASCNKVLYGFCINNFVLQPEICTADLSLKLGMA